ncbi:Alpha/Beta hydrolase protein [Biscogniauxia mediterranea]|nr:Alpha/Beta hydrolase protein [Biscogniauxia mediterranea]
MLESGDQREKDLPDLPLPEGVEEDYVDCTDSCGLRWHILKSGQAGKPLVLFCHGYPELSYSWRKVLPRVAGNGFYCVAMDQRGYGRTTGWPRRAFHEVDLSDYVFTNLVRDLVCLVYKLGYTEAYSIIGHDFGAVSSATAALMRPDMFRSTIQLSHPHHAPPSPALGDQPPKPKIDIDAELAKLDPPRKHYKWYNSTAQAASDWDAPPQGLEAFLRGYFHLKSAAWAQNAPRPLAGWRAEDLAVMPEYYVMRKGDTMPQAVARGMADEQDPSSTETTWLPAADLAVYCAEWRRTGFQGALNWYRAQTADPRSAARDMLLYAGGRIEVPCAFISGAQDWGNYQQPGALESYRDPKAVKDGCFRGATLIEGAGHWVQQEQPDAVVKGILDFFATL